MNGSEQKVLAGLFSPITVEARSRFEQIFLRGSLSRPYKDMTPGERSLVQSAFELGYVYGFTDVEEDDD